MNEKMKQMMIKKEKNELRLLLNIAVEKQTSTLDRQNELNNFKNKKEF